jgi:hypothetical protein
LYSFSFKTKYASVAIETTALKKSGIRFNMSLPMNFVKQFVQFYQKIVRLWCLVKRLPHFEGKESDKGGR